jgi:hypothetical protein
MEQFTVADVHRSGDGVESGFVVDVDLAEQMGSKEKFWCKRHGGQDRYLLKFARPNTGEDWAEKISAALAGEAGLRLPHADVELATFGVRPAVLVRDFLGEGERLIHGNELLLERDPDYPYEEMRRVRQHTLTNVLDVLAARKIGIPDGLDLPDGVRTAADLYSGYLVLDALVGNTDRHHENWGIVVKRDAGGERALTLAPTYDHGSSLGRELLDEERRRRRKTADRRAGLTAYADRARSAFFGNGEAAKPLGTFDLLRLVAESCGCAVRAWIDRLEEAQRNLPYRLLVDHVPAERMSIEARKFTTRLLEYNLTRILEVAGRL